MDDKLSDAIGNICTILGGALLLYPLIDQATKALAPEIKKLTSGEMLQEVKALPPAHEKPQESQESQEAQEPKKEQEQEQEKPHTERDNSDC